MTAEIVNLRGARKAKQRSEKDRQAAANRVSYGRTKEQRQMDAAEQERRERLLSGKRLDESGE